MRVMSFGFQKVSPYQAAKGQMYGANAAEYQLAQAVLARDATLNWDVVCLQPNITGAPASQNRLQERALSDFSKNLDGNAIFLVNPPSFAAANRLRANLPIPLCTLVHSVWGRHGFAPYLEILLHARPGDTLVATSAAAEQALNILLADAQQTLGMRGEQQRSILKIARVPLGVGIPDVKMPGQSAARALFGVPENAFVILCLGRLSSTYKADLAPLLLAVSALDLPIRPTHCILAGQSSADGYVEHLQRIAESCGLSQRIVILENFPEFLKSSLYAAADVCVAPADSVQETFGLGVLEAMAYARPVIAANWSGYRDLVEDQVTGYLLPTFWNFSQAKATSPWATKEPMAAAYALSRDTVLASDKLLSSLQQLAASPHLAYDMGAAGRLRAERLYAWPHIADRFLALWRAQLSASREATSSGRSKQLSLDRTFRHYASGLIQNTYLLARIPDLPERWTLQLIAALGHSAPEAIVAILRATAESPCSLHVLERSGFYMEDLIWIAKKGLRRLVDPDRVIDA